MKRLRVLVACEESQEVCKAFRARGHEAYSCDIQECSGGHPEWHIKDDVLKHLNDGWDLIIAHPPCSFLSNAGAAYLFRNGVINEERLRKGLEAKEFFLKMINSPCHSVCVENPISSTIFCLPKHSQQIQPFQFGHPFQKKTRLWLRGLPLLKPTEIVEGRTKWISRKGTKASEGSSRDQRKRSKTFPGIARAMAEQWSDDLTKNILPSLY